MKFKRMASAVMAAVMAVTSAVVCEVTASAQPIGFGASVANTWEQADFVNSSSAEMANMDLSNVTSVTFNAVAYDLNYGWNNGQFYVDGASWGTKSFGGTNSNADVTINNPSAFSVTADFAVKDDGTWALGWGTSTASGAFAIESIEFYSGTKKIGTWANNAWYVGNINVFVLNGFGASVANTWEQADFVNSSSAEMANVDISNVTSVTFNAVAYDLNYGWNNGQFYVDGASWGTKSFGGTNSNADVTINNPGAFSVTAAFAAKDDGTWALGWGTGTATGAFAIESIEFYAGANQLGIWTNGVWIGKDVAVTDVTLDKTTLTLEEGETTALTATVTPDNATDKTVTWSSDATDVATVDSTTGTITAVKAGTANITAKAGDKEATCVVTVTPVPVKTVTIDKPSQTTYKVGDTATLTASVNSDATVADKDIVWSSSDDTVAAIDETTGAVEFKAEGTVTITAAYKSDKTIKDTITLTVTNDEIPVSTVTITRTGKSVYTVGDSLTLAANVNSDATVADKDIVWSSSDESIATIDENTGAVTFITNGHVTFTASYKSDTTISDSVDITVLAADYVESVIEYNKTATTPTKIMIGNSDSVAYVMAISKADAEANSSVKVTITADGRTFTKNITTVYKQFKYIDNNGAKYIETGADDTYFVIVRVKGTTTVNSLSATMELVK